MITPTNTALDTTHNVHLTISTDIPTWALIGLIITSVVLLLWTMPKRRIEPTPRKIILTCRLVALWTGVLILAGPSWTRETNHIQSDIVPIILDVSASMSIIEQGDSSRFDALVSVVSTLHDEAQQLTQNNHRRVDWFTFTDTVGGELVDVDGDILIPPPTGGPSMIGGAISEIINGLDGDRIAGVVLISDGRGPIGEVEAQLRRIGVGVWVIIANVMCVLGLFPNQPLAVWGSCGLDKRAFAGMRLPAELLRHLSRCKKDDSVIQAIKTRSQIVIFVKTRILVQCRPIHTFRAEALPRPLSQPRSHQSRRLPRALPEPSQSPFKTIPEPPRLARVDF